MAEEIEEGEEEGEEEEGREGDDEREVDPRESVSDGGGAKSKEETPDSDSERLVFNYMYDLTILTWSSSTYQKTY